MSEPLAEASVKISPDLDGFAEELKAELDGIMEEMTFNVKVGLDREQFDIDLSELEGTLEAASERAGTIRIDLDPARFDTGLTEAEAEMAAFAEQAATVDLNGNTTDFSAAVAFCNGLVSQLDAEAAVITIGGDAAPLQGVILAVEGELAILNGQTVSLDFGGGAVGAQALTDALDGAAQAAAGLEQGLGGVEVQAEQTTSVVDGLAQAVLDVGDGAAQAAAGGVSDLSVATEEAGTVATHTAKNAFDLGDGFVRVGDIGSQVAASIDFITISAADAGLEFQTLDDLAAQLGLDFEHTAYGVNTVRRAIADVAGQTLGDGILVPFTDGLDEATQEVETATNDTGRFGGALESLSTSGEEAGSSMSFMGGMIGGIIALVLAAIPIVGLLVGVLGALAAIAFTGFVGVAGVALGAFNQLGELKKVALDSLTAYQQALEPFTKPLVHAVIPLIQDSLFALIPVAQSASATINVLLDQLDSSATGQGFQTFIHWITENTGPAIISIASFGSNFLKTLAEMGEEGQPFITMVEGGLANLGRDLATFGQSNTFKDFVQWLVTNGPTVVHDLESIGSSVGKMLASLAPVGLAVLGAFQVAMQDLVPIFQTVGSLFQSMGPTAATLVIEIGAVGFALVALSGPLTTVAGGIAKFLLAAGGEEVAGGGLAVGLGGLVAGLGAVVASGGVAIPVILGITAALAIGAAADSGENQAAQIAAWNKQIDVLKGKATDITDIQSRMSSLTAEVASFGFTMKQANEIGNPDITGKAADALNKLLSGMSDSSIFKVQTLGAAFQSLQGQLKIAGDNETMLEGKFGLTQQSVESLAQSLNINLSKKLSPEQVVEFAAGLKEASDAAHVTTSSLEQLAQDGGISVKQLSTDITNSVNAAKKAWGSYGDAVTNFASVTAPPSFQDISNFYTQSATQATAFASNVQKAIQAGYSPTLISQILQAGPAQAGQLLQGLVNQQGTALAGIIDQSTAAMNKAGAFAIEEARLTQEAVSSKSSQIAGQLNQAFSISQALMSGNVKGQLTSLITNFSGGILGFESVAHNYGIALPTALVAQIFAAQQAAAAQAAAATGPKGLGGAAAPAADAGTAAGTAFGGALGGTKPAATTGATTFFSGAQALFDTLPGHGTTAGTNTGTGFVTGFAGVGGAATGAATKVGTDTVTAAGKTDAKPAGVAIMSGIVDGINTSKGKVNDALFAAVKAAENFVIPLAGGQGVGEAIDNGVVAGIAGNGAFIGGELLAVVKSGIGFAAANAGGQSIGAAIDGGVVQGINENSGSINAAAASAVSGAITHAATSKTGANATSPSKNSRDWIGLPIVQGIVQGIEQNAYLAADAAVTMVGGTLTAMRNHVAASQGIVLSVTPSLNESATLPTATLTGIGDNPTNVSSPNGELALHYNPQYVISGEPDAKTTAKWKAMFNDHDTKLLEKIKAR